jgi:hypothetical protein
VVRGLQPDLAEHHMPRPVCSARLLICWLLIGLFGGEAGASLLCAARCSVVSHNIAAANASSSHCRQDHPSTTAGRVSAAEACHDASAVLPAALEAKAASRDRIPLTLAERPPFSAASHLRLRLYAPPDLLALRRRPHSTTVLRI